MTTSKTINRLTYMMTDREKIYTLCEVLDELKARVEAMEAKQEEGKPESPLGFGDMTRKELEQWCESLHSARNVAVAKLLEVAADRDRLLAELDALRAGGAGLHGQEQKEVDHAKNELVRWYALTPVEYKPLLAIIDRLLAQKSLPWRKCGLPDAGKAVFWAKTDGSFGCLALSASAACGKEYWWVYESEILATLPKES